VTNKKYIGLSAYRVTNYQINADTYAYTRQHLKTDFNSGAF